MKTRSHPTRAACSMLLLACITAFGAAKSNPIQIENRKPGAADWQLTRVRLDKAGGYRSPAIEGYCSQRSVSTGESFDLMVSSNPPAR
ncbi:MAG: hypothetical protein N2689_15120, partial [Verrucomicrobiae bacterium]|nr:hypothetical protein [Verrucomicrobiae bacterium]